MTAVVFADWWPDHTTSQHQPPEVGQFLAFQHAVWRVVEVRRIPVDLWTDNQRAFHDRQSSPAAAWRAGAVPVVVVVRPAAITSDDPTARRHDVHLSGRGGRPEWQVYRDEHYPVCGTCGEPTPCRERLGMRVAEREMNKLARYEQAGVCPNCAEPVTGRQRSWTCPDNLELPGGPPITYHVGRLGCRWGAAAYEKRWVALDPQNRTARWSCVGTALTHNDGTYECSAGRGCAGPLAEHETFRACWCGECRRRGIRVNARPTADATRRDVVKDRWT